MILLLGKSRYFCDIFHFFPKIARKKFWDLPVWLLWGLSFSACRKRNFHFGNSWFTGQILLQIFCKCLEIAGIWTPNKSAISFCVSQMVSSLTAAEMRIPPFGLLWIINCGAFIFPVSWNFTGQHPRVYEILPEEFAVPYEFPSCELENQLLFSLLLHDSDIGSRSVMCGNKRFCFSVKRRGHFCLSPRLDNFY